MPVFLIVPKYCQKFAVDPTTATKSVKKQNSVEWIYKDHIGFIQQFTNRAAPYLANRKELWGASCTKWKAFIGRWRWDKEVSNKECIVSGKVIFLWGKGGGGGVYHADYFTSADQVIPD